MNRPLIKAGGLTNLTDARYFAAMEVEWLGFLFEQNNENALSIEAFRAIKSWVEGPKIIAEIGFVESAEDYVSEIYEEVDGFQVQAFQEVPTKWYDDQKVIIREIRSIEHLTETLVLTNRAQEILLFDLNIEEINTLKGDSSNAIFDFPKGGEALIDWVKENTPYGIQLKGGDEEKVGFKSYDEIDAFFDYFYEHS